MVHFPIGIYKEQVTMIKKYKPNSLQELKELVSDKSVHLGDIDTSLITDMTELFKDSTRKNFDGLETWDTSNVTTMERMFHRAKYFNHPIGNWDVSSVMNMECIFCGCSNFNQPLDRWDVSNAKDMAYMFCKATSFRQPITAWRLCSQSTKGMFLRLPDYRDMESRVMCLTPHDEEAMRYDLEDMIGIFGEEAVQDALRLYGPKYGLKED